MPNDEVKISQLPVGTLGNGSLFETSQVNGEGYESTKVAATDLGNYTNTVLQYAGLKTAVLNVVGAVNSVLAIFADEYNTTTYYNPGWYCIKDGVLYVCQNDTHGTWSEGAWTETTVDEALRSMKGEIEYFDLIKFNSDNVAAFHSTTTAYSKGDYCINDEDLILYRAKVDIPTGTAWDSTKWEAVTICDDIKSLNDSRLDDLPVVTMPYASVATFNTDRAVPLADVSCQIVAQQSGSGDPSPSNIRSISGFSSVVVSHSGEDTSTHTDITIPLGSTVYGGTLDATTGLLTVTHGYIDLGSLSWSRYNASGNYVFFANILDGRQYATQGIDVNSLCEIFPIYPTSTGATAVGNGENKMLGFDSASTYTYTRILVKDDDYTSASDFRSAVSGKYLLYELATPVTYQLTPTQLTALLGQNNIWADTGDTSVAYRESAQKYIDSNTGLSRAKVYSLNLSQGGAWINTGVDVTSVDTLMFERNDNGDVNLQVVIKKSQIAVYTGGADVYTTIYAQGGKPLNVRIYNNILYASYNGTGAATYVTNVYALKDVF